MLKQSIRTGLLSVMLLLAACASGPSTDDGSQSISNKDVDPAILSEYQYALSLMKNGENEQALQKFAQMVTKYPNLAGTFVNLGIIYLKEKRYEDAKKALLQATTISPANAAAYNHLGIAQRELGEFNEAKQSYMEALKYSPKYANAHLNIGILYDLYFNDLENALKHYQTYQELTGGKDSTVEKWVVDLGRRLGKK